MTNDDNNWWRWQQQVKQSLLSVVGRLEEVIANGVVPISEQCGIVDELAEELDWFHQQ
jgi:hypothetical protein